MTLLRQLSSQVGDRTEKSNHIVVSKCLARRSLLNVIATGLMSSDTRLAGDCAEVMTGVAEERPQWVAKHGQLLSRLLAAENSRVRWEAAHALALIARTSPETIELSLAALRKIILSDKSVIARDHAVDAVGNFAATSAAAAREAYPILVEALALWQGKQAAHALNGLRNVGQRLPNRIPAIRTMAEAHLAHPRGVVRKAAEMLLRTLGNV